MSVNLSADVIYSFNATKIDVTGLQQIKGDYKVPRDKINLIIYNPSNNIVKLRLDGILLISHYIKWMVIPFVIMIILIIKQFKK